MPPFYKIYDQETLFSCLDEIEYPVTCWQFFWWNHAYQFTVFVNQKLLEVPCVPVHPSIHFLIFVLASYKADPYHLLLQRFYSSSGK